MRTDVHTHTPVGDFESSRGCEHVADGGFGCDSHATELVIVLLIPHSSLPVFGPATVPGAQGLVALLQVHSVQVSIQLKWHRAGPALPRHSLTRFHLWIRRDRGIWMRRERGICFWYFWSGWYDMMMLTSKVDRKSIDDMTQRSMQLVSCTMNNSQAFIFVTFKAQWLKAHLSALVYHLMAAQTNPSHLMNTSKAGYFSWRLMPLFFKAL